MISDIFLMLTVTTLGGVGDPKAFTHTIPHGMFIVDLLFHLLHVELLKDEGELSLVSFNAWVLSTSLMIVLMDNFSGFMTLPTS